MDDNFIEGFLIGTKKNANGWQVSPQTLPQLVDGFIGKPFTIIPDKLVHNVDAHFHGATREETIDGYAAYKHGTIEKITGPFPYNDGTDDFYYNHITRLSNSKSASLLHQYGSQTKRPFAVSPHIWHEDPTITDYVQVFTPIGISLVSDGAYGDIAVINKICQGTAETCLRSLGACKGDTNCDCHSCNKSTMDDYTANILSSHFSKTAGFNYNNMSVQNTQPQIGTIPPHQQIGQPVNVNPTPATLETTKPLTSEPSASDKITLTKEQYDKIQEERKEFESTKTRLEALENEHKTAVLQTIFAADLVSDETTRNNLIEKWKTADIKMVKDLHQDFIASIVPSLINKAKLAETPTATTTTTPEQTTTATKSKSASMLKPEPKVSTSGEESKAAAAVIEPQKVNEIQLLRKYLFGSSG